MTLNHSVKNKISRGLMALILVTNGMLIPATQAANPIFFLSQSSGCGSTSSLFSGMKGTSTTVYICMNGSGEGMGFLGAEIQLNYDQNAIKASGIKCSNFDSCANLSEPGKIKLLAASGPLPEGKAVSTKTRLGSFLMTFNAPGSSALTYTKAQIINENNAVESRTGVSAKVLISAPEVKEVPKENPPVKELPITPEPEKKQDISPLPQKESLPGLKSVVITPLVTVGKPGQSIQLVGTALYEGGRPNENITSCFTCPTKGNPNVEGKTTYKIISGPGKISGSKVVMLPSAKNGQIVRLNGTFTDYKTGTSATSKVWSIKVKAPVEQKKPKPTEETTPALKPAAPPVEKWQWHVPQATDEVGKNAETGLEKELQKNSTLPLPSRPNDEHCVDNYPSGLDVDQDGLSDRTECYLKLNPTVEDTDEDTCFDGDEINLFYTNPLVKGDCSLTEMVSDTVLITDPKPDWIVRRLNIHGLIPASGKEVNVMAFPAVQKTLQPLMTEFKRLTDLLQQNGVEDVAIIAQNKVIGSRIEAFSEFLSTQQATDYRAQKKVVDRLEKYLNQTPQALQNTLEEARNITQDLDGISTSGTLLGKVNHFKEMGLGQKVGKGFELNTDHNLPDGTYDLVALTTIENQVKSSAPVRVRLDQHFEVTEPQPEKLDTVPLTISHQEGEAILSDLVVRIQNGRPVLTGKSAYGAQVFATWESLALASSIIADSSEGRFDLQAPRELETNRDHKITLYAVMTDEAGKARSETVSLNFHVDQKYPTWMYVVGIMLILILAAGMDARHRLKKIDALPPEHRAKENELYEAFGEKHHEEKPAHHQEKKEEVEAAFKDL